MRALGATYTLPDIDEVPILMIQGLHNIIGDRPLQIIVARMVERPHRSTQVDGYYMTVTLHDRYHGHGLVQWWQEKGQPPHREDIDCMPDWAQTNRVTAAEVRNFHKCLCSSQLGPDYCPIHAA